MNMIVLSYKDEEIFVEIVGMKEGYSVILQFILWYKVHTTLAKGLNLATGRILV